ncbi:MAG: hypothetical protein A2445_01035 [Candidatus Jacksonbacteria bacterium RIFOXYC2_FULL_44_29]|nr:MAG: Methicillin resistance protein [Parcubacteria group bacterium GW2011_GWC2_44_22]OGY76404.1 MAG: hypothetical protein A2240_00560 [Candidatus Jacksonbacteria bacterium RIFOXYA2_FULL_43_12]OGY77166.1 MAG: hypothetical protein A2295_04820 [Candidatus Jacksonbacteria bacterium RIFOXYB2_FULL_44_15]OGY78245.1 MAG: hypothetical protein A2550_01370 [Candidatus Jacksonbacteria bacterium RIFOXYD2_FULL_43_21]OGY79946.1 MAG: hypothetical protein A2445_01035 [Candidatus Jacksonbacteria bacterium RIF
MVIDYLQIGYYLPARFALRSKAGGDTWLLFLGYYTKLEIIRQYMSLKLLPNPPALQNFPNPLPHSDLLQSPLWGKIQEAAGRRVFYWGLFDDFDVNATDIDPSLRAQRSNLSASVLVIKYPLPLGKSWLYSPRLAWPESDLPQLIDEGAKIAKTEKSIFWKIEFSDSKFKILNLKLKIAPAAPLQYPETFIIDLSESDEALLAKMKPKIRYNIHLAQKRGVTIKWTPNCHPDRGRQPIGRVEGSLSLTETFDVFYDLLSQTATRQHIRLHPKKHYENILKILGDADAAAIAIAEYQNKPVAANLVTFYGDTAIYLHGGTDDAYKSVMAPYLLQWESLQEARRRGCKFYDFGGAAVETGKIDGWAGITRFKAGFGGKLTRFGETYDVVFNKGWYRLYQLGIKALAFYRR